MKKTLILLAAGILVCAGCSSAPEEASKPLTSEEMAAAGVSEGTGPTMGGAQSPAKAPDSGAGGSTPTDL